MKTTIQYNINVPYYDDYIKVASDLIPQNGTVINFPILLVKDKQTRHGIKEYLESNVLLSKVFSFTYSDDEIRVIIDLLTEEEYKIQNIE